MLRHSRAKKDRAGLTRFPDDDENLRVSLVRIGTVLAPILLLLAITSSRSESSSVHEPLIGARLLLDAPRENPAAVEQRAYENARGLLSPLGQFHFRGLHHPAHRCICKSAPTLTPNGRAFVGPGPPADASLCARTPPGEQKDEHDAPNCLSNAGRFHFNEEGDASMHTGALLAALAWRYKNHPDPAQRRDTLSTIGRILRYYELLQRHNDGCIGRNFVAADAYERFAPQNRHGTENSASSVLDDLFGKGKAAKFAKRYRRVELDDARLPSQDRGVYYLRYDVSLDAVVHSVAGLHWITRFTPAPERERARKVLAAQLEYYERRAWRIAENGKMLLHGDHRPDHINPIATAIELILKHNVRGETPQARDAQLLLIRNYRTYEPGIHGKKTERRQFNNYMALTAFAALADHPDASVRGHARAGLLTAVQENEAELNYFALAVRAQVFGENTPQLRHDPFVRLNDYHSFCGMLRSPAPAFFEQRFGYNWWENDAYEVALPCTQVPGLQDLHPAGLTGNEAYLQAYWWY